MLEKQIQLFLPDDLTKKQKCLASLLRFPDPQTSNSNCRSVSSGSTREKSTRWTLVCKVSSAPTVMAEHQRAHAVPAHVAHLIACPAHDITVATATAPTPLCENISLGALPGNMPGNIAQIADGIILTVPCQVARLPTVVARLLVGTFRSTVALLVAVVTEPQITRRQLRSRAFPGKMARLATSVADSFIRAITGHVAWLSAIPA